MRYPHFIILTVVLFSIPVFAGEPVLISNGTEKISIVKQVDYFEDIDSSLKVKDVAASAFQSKFIEQKSKSINFGYTPSTYWLRLKVRSAVTQRRKLLLELVSYMDTVEIYGYSDGRKRFEKKAGRWDSMKKRDLRHRNFIYYLPVEPDEDMTLFMKFASKGAVLIPLTIWSESAFYKKDHQEQMIFGIYFGIILIMILYNLFIFFSIKDTSYLYYSLFITSLGMVFVSIWGFGFEYLWSNIWWANRSMITFLGLTSLFGARFTQLFLDTSHNSKIMHYTNYLLILFSFTVIVMSFAAPYSIGVQSGLAIGFLTTVSMIVTSVICFLMKYRPARYFLLAIIILVIGMVLIISRNIDLLPYNFFTNYSGQIGSALMVMLLSLALADRINIMKDEKELIQQEAFEKQYKMTKSFERFVPNKFLSLLEKEDITAIKLGDAVQKEMTVLFTDIRSFTALSEKMTPEENFAFINDFLKRMGPIVRKHNGFIDKFLGDAIMALFPDKPDNAVSAAIDMQNSLGEYNRGRREAGYSAVEIGIGIHMGQLMVGTIGEEARMEGTVISDTVNLASRIESTTKTYGASVLISEDVFNALEDEDAYLSRFVGKVKVRGKDKVVSLIEILDGYEMEKIELYSQTLNTFNLGVRSFMKKDFIKAKECFTKVLQISKFDKVAHLYLSKIDK